LIDWFTTDNTWPMPNSEITHHCQTIRCRRLDLFGHIAHAEPVLIAMICMILSTWCLTQCWITTELPVPPSTWKRHGNVDVPYTNVLTLNPRRLKKPKMTFAQTWTYTVEAHLLGTSTYSWPCIMCTSVANLNISRQWICCSTGAICRSTVHYSNLADYWWTHASVFNDFVCHASLQLP